MFYIYTLGSTIMAILIVSVTYIIPLFLIKELDKITYVKGYRNNLKWSKKPILYLQNILVSAFFILSIGLISLIIVFKRKDELKLLKKQAYTVYSKMFVTPLLGICLNIGLFWIIYKMLYYIEAYLLLGMSMTIYFMLLYIIIPYYVVLTVKQLVNVIRVENYQLQLSYSEFRQKKSNKKEWLKQILLSPSRRKYIDEYLQIFDNELEWEKNSFVVVNYVNVPKMMFIIIIGTLTLNFVLSFLKYDVFNSNIEEFTVNIGNPIFVYYYVLVLIVICAGLLLTVLINWICNESILISPRKIVRKIRINLKVVLLLIVPILFTILAALIFVISYSQYSDSLKPYINEKEIFISTMERKNDYNSYNTYEKNEYIFRYSYKFKDDLNELEYGFDAIGNNNFDAFCVPINNKKINQYFNLDKENEATLKVRKYGISISDSDCHLSVEGSEVEINSNNDYYEYVSEQKKKEKNANYFIDRATLNNNEIEQILKYEAVSAIDSLWNEEMKDRGLT